MNNTNFAPTREGRIYTGVAEELERVPENLRPDMALRIMRLLSGSATLEEVTDGLGWGAYNWLSRIADEANIAENRRENNSERGAQGGRPKVDRDKVAQMLAGGMSQAQVAREIGVALRTIERIAAELKASDKTDKAPDKTPTKAKYKSVNVNTNVGCVGVANDAPATPYIKTGEPLTPEQIDAIRAAKSSSPAGQKGV